MATVYKFQTNPLVTVRRLCSRRKPPLRCNHALQSQSFASLAQFADTTSTSNKFKQHQIGNALQREHQKEHKTKLSGSATFAEHRRQLFNCKSADKLEQLLHTYATESTTKLDSSVYNAAIQAAGKLGAVELCESIVRVMHERGTPPDIVTFGSLFHALQLNDRMSTLCDKYTELMLHHYGIVPNALVATLILSSCIAQGDARKAEQLWRQLIDGYALTPNEYTYRVMIEIYGRCGQTRKAKRMHELLLANGIAMNDQMESTLLKAFLGNNELENALHLKQSIEAKNSGGARASMSAVSYIVLIAFYLKPTAHFSAHQALHLASECMQNYALHKLAKMPRSNLINLQFVAYRKLLEEACCKDGDMDANNMDKKWEYFHRVQSQPMVRCKYGLPEWEKDAVRNVLSSYLMFYNYDYEHANVVAFFERVSHFVGYWSETRLRVWQKPVIALDVHGWNYNECEFVMHYLLTRKLDEIVDQMGYEWKIICGKQTGAVASSKQAQKGLKTFVSELLNTKYNITCKSAPNDGVLLLNVQNVKDYVQKTKSA